MSPSRPKKPSLPHGSKPVIEGARRAIHGPDPDPPAGPEYAALISRLRRDLLTTPPDNFADGVRADKHWREDVCPSGENSPLGPYIPVPRPENTREIGGQGKYALFEPYMLDWFDDLTPEITAGLIVLGRRQVRRTILGQIVKENWLRAVAAGSAVGAAVQWGAEALGWVQAHLPLIQGVWRLVKTGIAP